MKLLAVLIALIVFADPSLAQEIAWPRVDLDKVIVVKDINSVPTVLRPIAARYPSTGGVIPTSFSFFRTLGSSSDFVVIDQFLGEGSASYLYQRDDHDHTIRQVSLVVGDLINGFYSRSHFGGIKIGASKDQLVTTSGSDNCEGDHNSYHYQYNVAVS
ncbi:MAG TPA: hypothetical protein VII21_04090, partial [Aestuariivirga sp.]